MVTAASVAVTLSAQTAQFESGMKKAGKAVNAFSLDFKQINNIAAGFTLGSMIENAASKMKALVASSFEAGVAQAALSETLGISAAKLAGMQLAAEYAEVSQEDLTGALLKVEANIGSAVLKGGELAATFQQLGLDAQTLADKPLDQALEDIADAIAKVDNTYQRAALAKDVFGKSGVKLMNILRGGSEALQQAQQDAYRFGTAISEVDVERFKGMDDSMDKMTASIKGVGLAIAAELAPWITIATNAWLEYFEAAKGKTTTGFEGRTWNELESRMQKAKPVTADDVIDIDLEDDLKTIASLMERLETPTEKLTKQADALARAFAFGTIEGDEFEEMMGRLVDQVKSPVAEGIEKLEEEVRNLGLTTKDIDLNNAFMHGANEEQMAVIEGLHEQIDAHKKLEKAMKANAEWQMKLGEDAKRVWEDTQHPLEMFTNDVENVAELFNEGFLDQETFERALLGYKNKLEDTFPMGKEGPSAKLAGSQDAFSAIDKFNRRNDSNNRSLSDLLREAKNQSAIQSKLAKETAAEFAQVFVVQGI